MWETDSPSTRTRTRSFIKNLFLEKRGSFGSKPDKWRPDAICNDPTLWINVDQRGSKGSGLQLHGSTNGTRQFVSPQVWIIWINAHKALIQQAKNLLIQMIHTCGEIICPRNPSLTGGIVLVQHESGNSRLMEQGRSSDAQATHSTSLLFMPQP